MTAGRTSGHYVVFEADGELAGLHKAAADKLREASEGYLRVGLSGLPDNVTASVRSHPSEDWELVLHHSGHRHGHVSEKVCAVELEIASGRRISHDDVGGIRACLRESLKDYQELGSDLPISLAEYWSPSEAIDPLFGNRRDARRLLGADYLRQQEGASGKGVNVVVVDQGVDKELVGRLGGNFGGLWHCDYPNGSALSKWCIDSRTLFGKHARAGFGDIQAIFQTHAKFAVYGDGRLVAEAHAGL